MGALTMACVFGPMPVPEAIERCREIEAASGGDHRTEGLALCARAQLEAMRGSFDEARALYARARAVLTEVGGSMLGASTALDSSTVEMLAGDHAAAERDLRRDAELLEAMGERYLLSTMEGVRAQALIALGRHDEAAAACARAEAAAAGDDIESQVLVRSLRAELHLHAGRTAEAAAAAADAEALLAGAEAPNIVADLAVVRGRIAAAAGDPEAAGRELSRAARLYRDKGNVVAERRVAEVRSALGLGPVTA
jgi:ATP/maltotriose-dependent transcriptional regulator MalT